MRILLSTMLVPFILFCGYGFLASFEPAANAMAFRVGYAVIGSLAVIGFAVTLIRTPGHD